VSKKHQKVSEGLNIKPVASRPTDPENGDIIYNSTNTQFEKYENGAWQSFGSVTADLLVPVGAVLPFAGTTAPAGYLLCNGSAVSRTTYANLFAVLAVSHGSGDGSTTFNIPDYRGRFMRGVDSTANRDPDKAGRTAMNSGGNTGNNVGSVQSDQFRSHTHDIIQASSAAGSAGSIPGSGNIGQLPSALANGGNETRPINAYVNYIIKV
jgi:microcystin-dependent protein